METQEKVLEEKLSEFNDEEPEILLAYFRTRAMEVKRDLKRKIKGESFDELVEKELYGRVLPKNDGKKAKLQIDVLPEIG